MNRPTNFILFFTFSIIPSFTSFSQEIGAVKVSTSKIKNATRALTIQRDSRVVAVVSVPDEKAVYRIHEQDIGEYYFERYDLDMNVTKSGKVVFPGKDGTYFSRIKKVIYRNNSFYVYYETNNRKAMTYVFLQRFNLDFVTSGPRILISKAEMDTESMLVMSGYYLPDHSIFTSRNGRYLGLYGYSDKKAANGEKYILRNYWVLDLDNPVVVEIKDSVFNKAQNSTYFDHTLGDDGSFSALLATWKPGGDGKDYKYICRTYKTDKSVSDAIVPIGNIWIADASILVEGDILTLVATYQNKNDKYELGKFPKSVVGCSVSRFSLSTSSELTNSQVEFSKVFTGKQLEFKKDGSVDRFLYEIKSVFNKEDGSLDVFLTGTEVIEEERRIDTPDRIVKYRYEKVTRYVKNYLPVLFRFNKNLASVSNYIFNTSPGDEYDLQTMHGYIPMVDGGKFSFITLHDSTIKVSDPKLKTAGKFKNIMITTISVDESGVMKQVPGAPFEVLNNKYLCLSRDFSLDHTNKKLFLFTKQQDKGIVVGSDFYLSSYLIP